MGRAFSDEEKDVLRDMIEAAGLKRFLKQGIRAVRIDDICADVSIAKGTFYAFFKSKEDLFMTIADARDVHHKKEMLEFLGSPQGSTPNALLTFFDLMMEKIETDPVLHVVREYGELAHLVRKLPPERLVANREGDRRFVRKVAGILKRAGVAEHASAKALESMMNLMLALSMQRAGMSSQQYDDTRSMLRGLFRIQLSRGNQ